MYILCTGKQRILIYKKASFMNKTISATDVRINFAQVMNEVMYGKDTYIVSRSGKPAIALIPIERLEELEQQREQRTAVLGQIYAQSATSPLAQLDVAEDTLTGLIENLVDDARSASGQ